MSDIINLNTAVVQIKQIADHSLNTHQASPYFFIVGAGISSPCIPLAREIIDSCQEKVKKDYGTIDAMPENISTADSYSFWLQKAYPSPGMRQEFFKELIQKANISSANMKLAHIIGSKKLANTIFTPNFDDHISKALSIMGYREIQICDNNYSTLKISQAVKDIQIVHIHGSYWFYDLCNLNYEILRTSEDNGIQGMAQLLQSFLREMSPIIIGYSGWENDVIMSCIKTRLEHRMANPIFWFCYKRSDIDCLPSWLTGNDNIVFVVPNTLASECDNDKIPAKEEAIHEEVLNASVVFDAFIKTFSIKQPSIFKNPFNSFVDSLSSIQIGDEKDKDIYGIKDLVQKIEVFAHQYAQNEDLLQEFYELYRESKDRKMLLLLKKTLRHNTLSDAELCKIALLVADMLSNSSIENEIKLQLCDCNITICEKLLVNQPSSDKINSILVVSYDSKFSYLFYNSKDEFYKSSTQFVDKYFDNSNPHIENLVARNMYHQILTITDVLLLEQHIDKFNIRYSSTKDNEILEYKYLLQIKLARKHEDINALKGIIQLCSKKRKLFKKCLFRALDTTTDLLEEKDDIIKHINSFIKQLNGESIDEYLFFYAKNLFYLIGLEENASKKVKLIEQYLVKFSSSSDIDIIRYNIKVLYEKICLLGNTEDQVTLCNSILSSEKYLSESKCIQGELLIIEIFLAKTLCDKNKLESIIDTNIDETPSCIKANVIEAVQALIEITSNTYEKAEILNKYKNNIIKNMDDENKEFINYLSSAIALEFYKNECFDEAQTIFIDLWENGGNIGIIGVNLAYMKRRGEGQYIKYSIQELLAPSLEDEESFALVNHALALIKGIDCKPNFILATTNISRINNDKIDKIIDWWKNIEDVGEKSAVFLLLNAYKNIEDPEGLALETRLNLADHNGWSEIHGLFSEANELVLTY